MLKSNIDKATGFEKRFEKIGTVVYENSEVASKAVAKEIADLIKVKQAQRQPCIFYLKKTFQFFLPQNSLYFKYCFPIGTVFFLLKYPILIPFPLFKYHRFSLQ